MEKEESTLITPPLRFTDGQQGVYGEGMSRRCLRRKLPFLPDPDQASIKYLANEFGEEPKIKKKGDKILKKTSLAFFVVAIFLSISGLAMGGPTVTQVSTYDAILNGIYDGYVTAEQLLSYGDLGIGTYHALYGEIVLVDGNIYQIKDDGKAYIPAGSLTTPFALVTKFKPEITARVEKGIDFPSFEKILNTTGPNKNLFWAIRMRGNFSKIRLRSVPEQKKPYPPLTEVTKTQPIFDLEDVPGTIVGFRTPAYFRGLGVPGFHFHFISRDLKAGGHVLAFTLAEGSTVEIDMCSQYFLILPGKDKIFSEVDLSVDRSADTTKTQR